MRDLDVVRDADSAPFFDAAEKGRLLLRRCAVCETWTAPYIFWRVAVTCSTCHGTDLRWERASAVGHLVSWTTIHERDRQGDVAKHCLALVELAEGPWMSIAFEGDASDLAVGRHIRVSFRQCGSEQVPVAVLAD